MAIEFACSSCSRPYRVKDELAGKTAKCGKCGSRMQIPQSAVTQGAGKQAAGSRVESAHATKSAAADSSGRQRTSAQPAKPQRAATQRTAAPASAQQRAAAQRPQSQAANRVAAADGSGSWLDSDLAAAPAAQNAGQTTCVSCGKQQPTGGVICAACGEMLPAPPSVSNRPLPLKPLPVQSDEPKKKKRKKKIKFDFQLGSIGTLVRGTALSVVFTLIGATIWAVVAFFTNREFGIIAWGMGGMAGLGMALGHDDDDGTLAGIIAAFVSLFGIIAAKVLIIIVVVAAAVAGAMGEGALDFDPDQLQREILAARMASESIEEQGIQPENVTDQQWEAAMAAARAEVATMDPAQIEQKMEAFDAELEAEMAAEEANEEVVDGVGENEQAGVLLDAEGEPIDVDQEMLEAELALDDQPGFLSLFFQSMFHPIDGLFILLAFFTAYKVGSGQQEE